MMPNLDPRQLKRMMDSMGIKSTDIEAEKVVIHCPDRDIVISSPQVTKIDAKGNVSFQIAGEVSEVEKEAANVEISDDDVRMVAEQSGISDQDKVRSALEECNGNIAEAIMKLKEG